MGKSKKTVKYQRLVSLAAGLSFVIIFASSAVLYFIPDRGVTGWTAWSFLGLDKQQWDNLHINLGILFLVLIVWHIYFNWKPIKAYLKVKKEWKVFTREFNIALIVIALFTAGTITMTFPLSFLVNIGNGIKARNSLDDGNPPFAYAEYATLEDFALITHTDPTQALQKLKSKGIHINTPQETLKEIASHNHTSPRKLFALMRGPSTWIHLPSSLPVGIAKKSIKQLAQEYRIDAGAFIAHLQHYGIKATPESTFKRLAKIHNLHPAQLYNMLLASQTKVP